MEVDYRIFETVHDKSRGPYVRVSTRLVRRGDKEFEEGKGYQMLSSATPLEGRTVYIVTYFQHLRGDDVKDEATKYFFEEDQARRYLFAIARAIEKQQGVEEVDVHYDSGKKNMFKLLEKLPVNNYTSFRTPEDTFSVTLAKTRV